MTDFLDQPSAIRPGEELPIRELDEYLKENLPGFGKVDSVLQFPGGYSNLTYLVKSAHNEFVLRTPPVGANIKSAHDMGREFRVLTNLKAHYSRIPDPIIYCQSEDIIGVPFYLMERVKGIILRGEPPPGIDLNPESMKAISESTLDNLVELHSLDIYKTGLVELGKPEGYVQRQIEGWVKRYYKAETDKVESMDTCAQWLAENIPTENPPVLLHNDYKFDNLVLDPGNFTSIIAVLDWEMATVGDPLMDLGTSLAYWAEPDDESALKAGSLTRLPGTLNREDAVQRYSQQSARDVSKIVFYYVYGCFKLGVIVQQIYSRFKKGVTQDPRFASLLARVVACGENGSNGIKFQRISHFY